MDAVKTTINTKPCPRCGRVDQLTVTKAGVARYLAGTLIQNAFPELTLDQREQMMTGFCPNCWTIIFGGMDEDEDKLEHTA